MKSALNRVMLSVLFLALFAVPALADPAPVTAMNKVIWVWLEDATYTQMIEQKFVKSLISDYPTAKFSNYFPNSTITQADVMMMITGSNQGVPDNTSIKIFSRSLVDLLEAKSIPWKVYAEDFPGACYLGDGTATYKRYRVPFLSLSHVESDRYQCMNIVGLPNFTDDLQYGLVPQFSVIIPNLPNSGVGTSAATADATLKTILTPIIQIPTFTTDTTVIISSMNMITNADDPKGMFVMILGAGVQDGANTITTSYSHANLLGTIETGLGLGNLGQADATASPLVGFWN
jgi:acid phosphatase